MGVIVDLLISLGVPLATEALRGQDKYKGGSPSYEWNTGAVAASGSVDMTPDTQFPGSRTYGPLDSILCINNDVVDVMMILNSKENYFVPAGVIQPVQGEIGINHVRITNLDAGTGITAGAVRCRLEKAPKDVNDLARGLF